MYRTTLHTGNAVSRQIGPAVYDPRHETVEGVATLYKRSPAGALVARDTLRMAANVDRESAERYARERWHDKLTSDHAISIRVAGDSVPAFIAMTPTPTVAAAIAYARDVLPSGAIICGSVVPVGDVPMRNVLFSLAGDRTRRVLSVWFEGSSLYGEW